MDRLRLPFFVAALVLQVLVVGIEIGAGVLGGDASSGAGSLQSIVTSQSDEALQEAYKDHREDIAAISDAEDPPGIGIAYMGLVDGVLLFTVGLMAVSLLLGAQVHGRIQGAASCLFSLLVLIGSFVLLLFALFQVLLMIALFTAVPFGTLAYLAVWGFFDRGGAIALLGTLMTLKLAFVVCLVLAHQRFLQQKGLVLLVLTSFLAHFIVSLLHGLVPVFLVSITDGIAAIVVAVLALIWGVALLIGSIPAILRALRARRV